MDAGSGAAPEETRTVFGWRELMNGWEEYRRDAGTDVVVPESDVFTIEDDDVFYEFDLVGCTVELAGGEVVGTVGSILHTGAGELLSVVREGRTDALVPFVDEICIEVDTDARRIVIDPPEGLLDL